MKLLTNIIIFVLSCLIVIIGFVLFDQWRVGEFNFLNYVFGFIGYLIAVKPAMDHWEQVLKKLFNVKEETEN